MGRTFDGISPELAAWVEARAPRIVRFQGRGAVLLPGDAGWDGLVGRVPDLPGARAIVHVDVDRVADSCGYAVPLMDLVGDRDRLLRWAEARGERGLADYRSRRNAASIDGLPALDPDPVRPTG